MVSCVTDPHLASCLKAAATVALVVATGGEGEVEVAAADIAEDAGAEAAEDAGGDAADAAASCGGMSFTAGTEVLLASGKAVPISSLKPGEKVLATNTKTGTTQAEAVAAVLVRHDTDLYDLRVKAGNRTAVISDHPQPPVLGRHVAPVGQSRHPQIRHPPTHPGRPVRHRRRRLHSQGTGRLDVGPHHPGQRRPRLLHRHRRSPYTRPQLHKGPRHI